MSAGARSRIAAALLALALGLAAGTLHAAEAGLLLTEQLQLEVADAFLARGEPYRAVTEYQRFLILFPGSARADEARLGIGEASWRGEDYEAAARAFASVREAGTGGPRAAESAYREGVSWWRAQHPERALPALDALAGTHPGSAYALRGRFAGALVALEEGDVAGARTRLEAAAAAGAGDPAAARAREALALLARPLPRKSPTLAAWLSALLPGSGYVYAGHAADGATAFAINGLFIAGAVTAARQENYALAALAAGIGLPFYAGNVYGSANAARKWNLGVRRGLRDQVFATLDFRF